MMVSNFKNLSRDVLQFIFGFSTAFTIFTIFHGIAPNQNICEKSSQKLPIEVEAPHNESLSNFLSEKVKILCLVFTHPPHHRKLALQVKRTWGKKCTKILFVTSQDDPELPTLTLEVQEAKYALRNKTKESFMFARQEFFDDFDWFMKADDDTFVIMENLRYMLSQYRSETALYFGHRFTSKLPNMEEGYMAGSAYILSKKALEKFAYNLTNLSPSHAFNFDGDQEDLNMGSLLSHSSIFVDCRDEKKQKRFFPTSPTDHLRKHKVGKFSKLKSNFWYDETLYYPVSDGSLKCCSDVPIAFHYNSGKAQLFLQFIIYKVHPFGVDKNSTEILPRKLTLKEILKYSDVQWYHEKYKKHKDYHRMEPSEIF